MPALPPVANTLKVSLVGTLGSDVDVVNIIHFTYSGATTTASLDTLATTVESAYNTHVLPIIHESYLLEECHIADLTSDISPVGESIVTHGGAVSGASTPAEVAAVVRRHIPRRYRGGHPKVYVAGIPQADMATPQTWTSGFLSAMQAAWTAFEAECIASPPTPITDLTSAVVSYYQGFTVVTNPITGRARNVPKLRVAGPVVFGVDEFNVNPKIASQRRRSLQSA
jgi:hypothetical protein